MDVVLGGESGSLEDNLRCVPRLASLAALFSALHLSAYFTLRYIRLSISLHRIC